MYKGDHTQALPDRCHSDDCVTVVGFTYANILPDDRCIVDAVYQHQQKDLNRTA